MFPLLTAVIAALAIVLAPPAGAEAAKKGGTLKIGLEGEAPDLDMIGPNFIRKVYRETIGNGLLKLDENFNVVGDAAKSWEISPDGRVITFKLHPGGTFHDGTPLDAESVKWNLDIINGAAFPKWVQERQKKEPKYKYRNHWVSYLFHIEKVEVVDKYTLRVHQKDVGKAQTLDAMASAFDRFVLVSPKAYDDVEQFRRKPVMSGPFKFVEWKRNQHFFAERHKGYFDKNLPHVDRLEYYYMPDANQRMNALAAGQIDIINNLPLPLYETAKKTAGVTVHSGLPTTNYAFPFNAQMDPWKDVRVRKAISCFGVDRVQVVQTALRGLGKPWVSYTPAGAKDTLDLNSECPYDPERAKKLLAEAGYGPGKKPLKFTMVTNNSDPAHLEVAQSLKSQFAKIGADMEIQIVDYATWNRAFVVQRKVQITLQNTLSGRSVNTQSHTIHTKSGIDYYNIKDPKVDELLDAWRSTIDPRKQLEISHRLQRYMVEQAYYPNLASFPFVQAARSDVKGFKNLGKLILDYSGVWLDR